MTEKNQILTLDEKAQALVANWLASYKPDVNRYALMGLQDRIRHALEVAAEHCHCHKCAAELGEDVQEGA